MRAYINFLNIINNRKLLWLVSFLILAMYFSPYIMQGQNLYLILFDNLDSVIPQFKILAESGKIFADSTDIIPNMMNGLPRLSYGTEFNITLYLYYFFDPFTAYAINDIIVHIFALIGMVILLSAYIIKDELKYSNLIIFSVSIFFALVPFWSNSGLSIAGQPLVLYAFLNIRKNSDNKWDWLILLLIPFYSSFVFSFFFFLFSAGLVFLYDIYKTKQLNYKFILAIMLMTTIYLLVEYRLIYSMFIEADFISHRIEFNSFFDTFYEAFRQSHFLFLNGQEHNINLHYRYVLPIILLAMFISLRIEKFNTFFSVLILSAFFGLFFLNSWSYILTKEFSLPLLLMFTLLIWIFTKDSKLLPFLLIIQILISYITGFSKSTLAGSLADTFHFFSTINIRFMMLQTLIWYILLALSLKALFNKLQFSLLILIPLIILQIQLSFEYRNFDTTNIKFKDRVTFNSYYAPELYKEIEKFINKPKESYRIVSVGIEPAVSLYNGFYTIDGYSTNYPLTYKKQFRKIIKKHLDSLKPHQGNAFVFDDWGSKLYILSEQYVCSVYKKTTLKNLSIDVKQLSSLKVKYIFSAYEIEDYKTMDLKFLKVFNDYNAYCPVYLYEIP